MTEYLGLGGLALVAFSLSALWISRMYSNASTPAAVADNDEHVEPVRLSAAPVHLQFKLTPDVVVEEVAGASTKEDVPEKKAEVVRSETVSTIPRAQQQVDSESAFEQLKIAESLSLIGDFEGVQEYAELVLADKSASDRQRAQAESLLLNASSL